MNLSPLSNSIISLFIACSSALLLAIWAIPETIALRHALLISGFCASFLYLKGRTNIFFKASAWPFWVLLGFYAWLALHLIFFSHEFELQLLELHSLWARAALATFLGLALGLSLAGHNNPNSSANFNLSVGILFLGLCGTGFISLIHYCAYRLLESSVDQF
jgi:hypothetical protein